MSSVILLFWVFFFIHLDLFYACLVEQYLYSQAESVYSSASSYGVEDNSSASEYAYAQTTPRNLAHYNYEGPEGVLEGINNNDKKDGKSVPILEESSSSEEEEEEKTQKGRDWMKELHSLKKKGDPALVADLYLDFKEVSSQIGKTIIMEKNLPVEMKTLKPLSLGMLGSLFFFFAFFTFAI